MDQEKQRQQIIQQGYDPGQFVDYLSEIKLAADIDLLSLNQVRQAVDSFKIKKVGQGRQPARTSVTVPDNEESKIESELQKKSKQIYYVNIQIFKEKYGMYEDEFQRTYKCIKFSSYPKNKSIIPTIYVSDPQRKTAGGFFFGVGATSFLSFKIQTPQYNWSVRRRYSDFQWLRNVILKMFPSYVAPPLPKKNAKKKTTRDIQKRMHILAYFLNDISSIPTIMHSKYIVGFLNLSSEPEFQELKRLGNANKGFQSITQLQTQNGNLTLGLTQKDKLYFSEMDKLSLNSQAIYKEMTGSSKQLQACFIEQTNTLYKIGNLCADLYTNVMEFNNKVSEQYQQNSLADTYVVLNNMMVEWGNIVREQHAFIQKNFNAFIRYTRNEIYSIRQHIAKIQNIEQQFFKNNVQLQKKKEKIFSLNDFSKWDVPQQKYPVLMQSGILKNKDKAIKIMLPKQTYEVQKLRIQYAFYMSQFCEHSCKMMRRQSSKFSENFKEFAITIKVNAQQLSEMWNQISGDFSNPKKKEIVIQKSPQLQQKSEIYDD